jgi:hypothetical protein
MPPQQRITLNPANPVQGGTVRICYDFLGTDLIQTTLTVTFTPGGQTTQHVVTETDPCFDIDVPGNATSIVVHDEDGDSPDKTAAVQT